MRVSEKKCIKKPYILLDWNVIKYLKSPRSNQSTDKDIECFHIIKQIEKKYAFPFCEAHLRDLQQSYSQENVDRVNDDLEFLSSISKGICLESSDDKFVLIKHSVSNLFYELINEKPQTIDISIETVPQSNFPVDMTKIEESHPLYQMLKQNNGEYTAEVMARNINEMFYRFFDTIDDYKNLRTTIQKLRKDLTSERDYGIDKDMASNLIKHMDPFINSLEIEKEEELAKVWKDVCEEFLKVNGKQEIPYGELLTEAYTMLDLHPIFREKLKKKNTLSNIVRDSKMVFYASGSKFFVTEDKDAFKKMNFLFKAFGEKTEVLDMEMFVQKFS